MRANVKDDCFNWVIPAITIGYSVCNDPDGKLRFWTDTVEIVCRNGVWIAFDGIDLHREYDSLRTALEKEA